MKALVFQGPGQKALIERPIPAVRAATDALVRMTTTTIAARTLHILKGDVPRCALGHIPEHEGVGIIVDVGSAVSQFKKCDRVLISCIL